MFLLKKVFLTTLCLALFPLGASTTEAADRRDHSDWSSEAKASGAIMWTPGREDTSLYVIFDKKNNCGVGFPAIWFRGKNPKGVRMSGMLAIDDRAPINITYFLHPEGDFTAMFIEGADGQQVFQDAVDGRQIRFYSARSGQRYLAYSLMGFTAAYTRAQNLCRRSLAPGTNGAEARPAKKPQKRDKDFFEDGRGRREERNTNDDASFF